MIDDKLLTTLVLCLCYSRYVEHTFRLQLYTYICSIFLQIAQSMAKIDNDIKEAAYHAWLGYYNSIREIGREKSTVAELASRFSESIGLQRPPSLFRKTALKMGLKDIPGIRIRK
jgi:hypothetical protein